MLPAPLGKGDAHHVALVVGEELHDGTGKGAKVHSYFIASVTTASGRLCAWATTTIAFAGAVGRKLLVELKVGRDGTRREHVQVKYFRQGGFGEDGDGQRQKAPSDFMQHVQIRMAAWPPPGGRVRQCCAGCVSTGLVGPGIITVPAYMMDVAEDSLISQITGPATQLPYNVLGQAEAALRVTLGGVQRAILEKDWSRLPIFLEDMEK